MSHFVEFVEAGNEGQRVLVQPAGVQAVIEGTRVNEAGTEWPFCALWFAEGVISVRGTLVEVRRLLEAGRRT